MPKGEAVDDDSTEDEEEERAVSHAAEKAQGNWGVASAAKDTPLLGRDLYCLGEGPHVKALRTLQEVRK
mgnify:FL=1